MLSWGATGWQPTVLALLAPHAGPSPSSGEGPWMPRADLAICAVTFLMMSGRAPHGAKTSCQLAALQTQSSVDGAAALEGLRMLLSHCHDLAPQPASAVSGW